VPGILAHRSHERLEQVHKEVVFRCPLTKAEAQHLTFEVDRGVSWAEARCMLAELGGDTKDINGFYKMQSKSISRSCG
jgi:hypothetical protein